MKDDKLTMFKSLLKPVFNVYGLVDEDGQFTEVELHNEEDKPEAMLNDFPDSLLDAGRSIHEKDLQEALPVVIAERTRLEQVIEDSKSKRQ